MHHLVIIGCGTTKAPHATEAKQLYTSTLFRLAYAYALRHADTVRIMSARHGLLHPEQIVEPYNQTLPQAFDDRRALGYRCQAQLAEFLNEHPDLMTTNQRGCRIIDDTRLTATILTGAAYADLLLQWTPLGNHPVAQPLRGLGIGHRQRYLTRTLKASTNHQPTLFA